MKFKTRILSLLTIITLCVEGVSASSTHLCTDSLQVADSLCVADSLIVHQPDSIVENKSDSASNHKLPWYFQLVENGFRIHDPNVNYPKFARFLLKVYDWGDKTFNSYDPQYVVGSGKNWKLTLNNYNWMESYMMLFSLKNNQMLHMHSDLYCDVGAHISFMAVGIGYTAKMNELMGGGKKDRQNLNLSFTCSRIFANFDMMSTNGNTVITEFGQYKDGESIDLEFNDVKHSSVSGEAFYIFNYSQYSHAAAYCFSKYQLKSAGSWLLGFAFNNQEIEFDFSNLPDEMKQYLPDLSANYYYRYTDYGVCGGYAHNWALKPKKWLANITIYPSVGYRHSYHDSTDRRRHMVSTSIHGRFAFVYNHKALFASLNGRFDGNMHFNSKYSFFNAVESLSLIVGARF